MFLEGLLAPQTPSAGSQTLHLEKNADAFFRNFVLCCGKGLTPNLDFSKKNPICRPLLTTVVCELCQRPFAHRVAANPSTLKNSTKSLSAAFEPPRHDGFQSILRKPCAPHIPMLAALASPRFSAARMVALFTGIGALLWVRLPVLKGHRLLFSVRPRPQTKICLRWLRERESLHQQ